MLKVSFSFYIISVQNTGLDFGNERYKALDSQSGAGYDFTQEMTSSGNSDQLNHDKLSHDHTEARSHVYHGYRYPQRLSTAMDSNAKIPSAKQQRRKLRQKKREEEMMERNQAQRKLRRFSSTSNDESNDDFSGSDNFSSDDEAEAIVPSRQVSKKTYL